MGRLFRGDVSKACLQSPRLLRQIRPHRIGGLPIGSERLATPLEFGVRLSELQPLRGESRLSLFEVREGGLVCLHGRSDFLFLDAETMTALLEQFLAAGEFVFISLKSRAFLA